MLYPGGSKTDFTRSTGRERKVSRPRCTVATKDPIVELVATYHRIGGDGSNETHLDYFKL